MTNGFLKRILFSAVLTTTLTAFAADPITDYQNMVYAADDAGSAMMFLNIIDNETKTLELVKFKHLYDFNVYHEKYDFEIPSTIENSGEIFTITKIGEEAFDYYDDTKHSHYNEYITKVSLPETIEYIGEYAFSHCNDLEVLTIKDNVEVIPDYMCDMCYNLTTLYLGKKIKHIGYSAFFSCSELSEIYISAEEPPTLNLPFFPNSVKTVYVPKGCVELYEAAWKNGDLANTEFKEYDGFGTPSGIMNVENEGVSINSKNGTICISGNYENSQISVYEISGLKVAEYNDSEISIPLPRGIYIVRIGSTNTKIIN